MGDIYYGGGFCLLQTAGMAMSRLAWMLRPPFGVELLLFAIVV
jgi:hypothetical protein